jgi:hypothetical protein
VQLEDCNKEDLEQKLSIFKHVIFAIDCRLFCFFSATVALGSQFWFLVVVLSEETKLIGSSTGLEELDLDVRQQVQKHAQGCILEVSTEPMCWQQRVAMLSDCLSGHRPQCLSLYLV